MNRLRTLWRNINSSLWFVPSLLVAVALLLAYFLVILDLRIGRKWVSSYPLLFGSGADGARGVLTAVAGSMMTVAALTFSLTLSTLAQVSNQYTPRVMRNFMSSRTNQLVLGCFVGIFAYCLFVLRTIRGGDEDKFIPPIAVTGGLVLALLSIGVLIFFIHHIASSIQATNIVREVTVETEKSIKRLFPQEMGAKAKLGQEAELLFRTDKLRWVPVPAQDNGYVQDIDNDGLLKMAQALGGVVRMEHGIGSFVARGATLASVARYASPLPLPLADETANDLNGHFSLGNQRSLEQDVGFGLRQIVDIALKALSPGINDTTTAIICIDYLGSLVAQLAAAAFPGTLRTGDDTADAASPVRVVAIQPSFAGYLDTAFDQIRVSGDGNVAVYLRLLSALGTAAARTDDPARHVALRSHAGRVREAAARTLGTAYERDQVHAHAREVENRLVGEKV